MDWKTLAGKLRDDANAALDQEMNWFAGFGKAHPKTTQLILVAIGIVIGALGARWF